MTRTLPPEALHAALTATVPAPTDAEKAALILAVTGRLFAVDRFELLHSRSPSVTRARQVAMAVVRASTDMSFPELGRLFGRDHTTVQAAVVRVEGCVTLRAFAAGVLAVVHGHDR